MIKLEVWVDDIDYDTLLEKYLPQIKGALANCDNPALRLLSGNLPLSAAKAVVSKMSSENKDALLSQILNNNSNAVIPKIEEFAAKNDINFKIRTVKAEKK